MSQKSFTKTATFLFPLLDIPKQLFQCEIKDSFGRLKHTNRFLNAYLEDCCIEKYKSNSEIDYVFILVRNYRDVEFEKFYEKLVSVCNYIDDYEHQTCLVFVFKIPQDNIYDFTLLKNGKYSEITKQAKDLILKNHFFSGKPSTLPLILNKAEVLKLSWEERLTFIGPDIYSPADLTDKEVWPIINMSKEILTEEIIESYRERKFLEPIGEF